MMSGIRLAQYTNHAGGLYNQGQLLQARIEEMMSSGLADDILFYYWDNENSISQWDIPVALLNTVKQTDVDPNGDRMHPIYVLQGAYNTARVHANAGVIDVSVPMSEVQ
jgi:hypothetical protein